MTKGTPDVSKGTITVMDVEIVATIRCAECGKTHEMPFGGEAPCFIEEAMGDHFADEGWTVDEEWYEEEGRYHPRRVLCEDCGSGAQSRSERSA